MAEAFEPSLKSAIKDLKTVVGLLKDTTTEIKNLADATSGMVKASKGKGKNAIGAGSFGMMDNALASFSGFKTMGTYKAVNSMMGGNATLTGLVGNAPKIMGGMNSMMPNFSATIDRATGYYNAIMAQGNRFGRASFEKSVLGGLGQGGLSAPGSDAAVAQLMSGYGINFSNAQGSFFQQTLRGTGNMARYFNMSNESAVNAMASLSSGTGSAMLMRNFGIMTSDARGRQLSTGQIINQFTQRLTAGRGSFTEEDIMNSFNRGNLGASLQASGLSQDQQMMVVQALMAQSKGKTFDPASDQAMKDAFGGGSGKNANPTDFQRGIFGAETAAMGKAEESYLFGAKTAGGIAEAIIGVGGDLAKTFGALNAAATVLTGTMATAGAMQALGGLGNVGITAMLAKQGGPALTGFLGKSGAFLAKNGGKLLKGAGIAGGAIGLGVSGMEAYNKGQSGEAMNAVDFGGAALSGAMAGASIGAMLAPVTGGASVLVGAGIGAVGGMLTAGIANSAGASASGVGGGNSSTGTLPSGGNSAGGTGGSKPFKLSKPVRSGVKPSAVFGQKKYNGEVIWPNGHNGVDYPVAVGTAVLAAAAGKVVAVNPDYNGQLGLHIIIQHPDSPGGDMHTLYAHLDSAKVKGGDTVSAGAVIGTSGKTGTKITGAHLHFGLMRGPSTANSIDPSPYLDGIPANLDPGDSGIVSGAGPSSNSGDSSSVSASGTTNGLETSTPPSASINGSAVTVGASGISGTATTISSQINNGANMGGSGSQAPAGTGVGGGETSAILSAASGAGVSSTSIGTPGSKRGNGNNVTINLTIASASETEARRFANKVKEILEDDRRREIMGSR